MRGKALLFATSSAGHGRGIGLLVRVCAHLQSIYKVVDVFVSPSKEEGQAKVIEAAMGGYEIIVLGGDGTFNSVCNALAREEIDATLGYVNAGTLGDVGRNFGITRRVGKALKIIEKGRKTPFDLVKATSKEGSAYFVYMLACGVYSEIPYESHGHRKAMLGRFDYYRLALHDALHKSSLEYAFEGNGKHRSGRAPFLLFLNGKRVAGFPVNRHGDISDGLFECFIAEEGAFNGLLHYLSRRELFFDSGSKFHVEVADDVQWCLDGEPLLRGSLDLEIVPGCLNMYTKGI